MAVRGLIVLAILAALMGAPSITFGATNNLTSSHVSPSSGTVDTIFTLTVDYEGKFAATGVTATVGERVLTMTRVSGTTEEGTYKASGTLPAGTWLPLFVATVESGTPPMLTGTAVTILGPVAPPTPVPTVGSGGGGPRPSTEQGGGVDPGDVDLPGAGSTPVAAPADGGDADDPAPGSVTATPGPGKSPDGAPGGAPGGGPGGGDDDGAPADGSGGGARPPGSSPGGGDGGDDGPGAAPADPPADPGPEGAGAIVPTAGESERDDEEAGRLAEDRLLGTVLVIGLSGVAAVAILGTALLVLGRRRPEEDDEAAKRASAAASTAAVLHQRTLRRAKVRLGDDPIVAAMGIEDEPSPRAPGAGQVIGDPEERPPPSGRP